MTDQEKLALFDELIVAAGQLATVADNFAVVLSQHFEDGVRAEVTSVRSVLERCPMPAAIWDGSIREIDLQVEYYQPEGHRIHGTHGEPGCKITHKPTGVSFQSESKPTREENQKIARRAVDRKVAELAAQRAS